MGLGIMEMRIILLAVVLYALLYFGLLGTFINVLIVGAVLFALYMLYLVVFMKPLPKILISARNKLYKFIDKQAEVAKERKVIDDQVAEKVKAARRDEIIRQECLKARREVKQAYNPPEIKVNKKFDVDAVLFEKRD